MSLTTSDRITLIRAAIAHVKEGREYFRQLSANPAADSLRIESARDSYTAALKEFGWQFTNIEVVLDELAPKEK